MNKLALFLAFALMLSANAFAEKAKNKDYAKGFEKKGSAYYCMSSKENLDSSDCKRFKDAIKKANEEKRQKAKK